MIRAVLIFSLILFLISVGYRFATPLVQDRMLQGKMVEIAKNRANKSDQALHADLMEYIRDKGIELGPDDIMIERHDEKVYIAARYRTVVSFYSYSRQYDFFPVSDEKAALYWKQGRRGVPKDGV